MRKTKKFKITYIINHASFFVSHRLKLFLMAQKKMPAKTSLIIGQAGSLKMEKDALKILKQKKISYCKTLFTSSKKKILHDIRGLVQIAKIFQISKPDLIHSASPKANFFSGIIFLLMNISSCIWSISGMGNLFTNKNLTLSDRFYKFIFLALLFLLKKKKNIYFILQNKFDLKIFNKKVGHKKTVYIPSSGVDFTEFRFKKNKKNIVVMPSRVLYDKGVEEFVYAAKKLKKKYKDWHFQIIGADDYNNPSSVPKSKLNEWIKKGYIIWKEYKNNPKFIYQNASIVCMPSHREGFSKVILEAGASSLPVVASNIPGCKEGIVDYETGLLFKVKNHHDLTKKLKILIKNSNLRNTMGKNGIKFIKQNYDINIVNKKIISVYQKILNEKKKVNTNSIK